MENNRWQNKGLWVAVTSLVLYVLVNTGLVNATELGVWETAVDRLLEVLILAGILSNPKEGTGFRDIK
ncbi:MAG: phage holin [Bacillota bacterium]